MTSSRVGCWSTPDLAAIKNYIRRVIGVKLLGSGLAICCLSMAGSVDDRECNKTTTCFKESTPDTPAMPKQSGQRAGSRETDHLSLRDATGRFARISDANGTRIAVC